MKYLKILGLAAMASVALAAAGAGTASATTLCTTNEACPTGHSEGGRMWQTNEIFKSTTQHWTINTPVGTVICTHSETTDKLTSTGVHTPTTQAPTFEWQQSTQTNCTRSGSACTVTAQNLPYKGVINVGTEPNGTMDVVSNGKGSPGWTVVCGVFINCTFSATTLSLPVTGGHPAKITANKVPLERSGGLCPSEASWSAEYVTTAATGGLFVK